MNRKWSYFRNYKEKIIYPEGSARGVTVILEGSRLGHLNSNLEEAVCISPSAILLWKVMNPIIFHPVMGEIVAHTGLFKMGMSGRKKTLRDGFCLAIPAQDT